MQTFLPYPDIIKSARVLDYRRLNKQILESDQMIRASLTDNDKFYKNHPCRKMWDNHVEFHMFYRDIMLNEWLKRGYKSSKQFYKVKSFIKPEWYKDSLKLDRLCKSHRKALLIKDINYYGKFFSSDVDNSVIVGSNIISSSKHLTRGQNKGKIKIVSATENKAKYIKSNNIYYWPV